MVSTKSDGAIVRSLEDKSTKFVAARSHNVTPLDSIEVFTMEDNLRLWDVFQIFKSNEAQVADIQVNGLDNKAIKANFEKLFPEYDRDRVYISDMKKMMKWYGILKSYNLLDVVEEDATTGEESLN